MKYHINEKFSKEEYEVDETEETTKQIVIIQLKTLKEGFDKILLNNLVDKAIEGSKKYKIFNAPEGLLVEKQMIK